MLLDDFEVITQNHPKVYEPYSKVLPTGEDLGGVRKPHFLGFQHGLRTVFYV